ncbi:MAG: ferredoxin:protochlorophyllide reductase (ATP-dependent) subunit B [Proteobacteria bacterium]|nr:ferredoxin:protochlorophyllide reductase (ATP-dependent) subunit B [Pseudomonadota bacterium]MDA0847029.1 ferredoxin:protochlorophyllide reductase (ATP-dependent) subunit B [Pseudomonadota bacterium]
MKLTLWTYEGPPHVGAMRIATAMRDVHYVLHAPQGDTYADLLFTMIERRSKRPPVTYTTFQARDLGKDTAALFQSAVRDVIARYAPKALLVGASCTAELIQDDPAGLSAALHLSIPVVPLELPSYQKKENWGAAETFYQIVRQLLAGVGRPDQDRTGNEPSCNLLGPTGLGFRHRDDLTEIRGLIESLGIRINVVAPWEADPDDIRRLPQADFNVVLYPETAHSVAAFLKRTYGQPHTTTIPIGIKATEAFIRELAGLAGAGDQSDAWVAQAGAAKRGRAQWYCGSVDSTYLTGKRVFVFGDATHAIAAAAFAAKEVGFEVVGLGSYSREFAKELRTAAAGYGLEATLTDDYLEVEATIAKLSPDLVLGTQMERHIAKRLGIPCAVISAPVHVQDFPARYSPQMGYEGANVLFDTWVHPLMMGLEEHLLGMFKDDFEFHESATASHLGSAAKAPSQAAASSASDHPITLEWEPDAERELGKIPFFVRSKARRNTEAFASEQGIARITKDTLYEAKAHYAR